MMGEEKFLFLINGDGDRALEDAGQSLPESVLRMMIEEMTFSGLDRWEGAKDQDPGAGVKNRWDRVFDGIHGDKPFNISCIMVERGGRFLDRDKTNFHYCIVAFLKFFVNI